MVQTTNLLLGGITFNEIGYDPNGPDPQDFDTDASGDVSGNNDEFIELINLGSTTINMTGVRLFDGTNSSVGGDPVFTFGSVSLAPGERFVILGESANLTTFQTANPGVQAALASNTGFNLNNGADQFALVDTANNYIKLTYIEPSTPAPTAVEDQGGFPAGATLLSQETINMTSEADGQSLQRVVDGDTAFVVADATPGAANCFLTGTAITTPTGEVAVEDLEIGDMITGPDGRDVAIRWVGRQTVSTRFGPAERLMPVRVRAGALGDGLPLRDLVLTADHALLIDGLLINAGALANGDNIDFVPLSELGDSYTVYHIETEDHAIILAEGTPAETFIDYVGRQSFDNYAEYLDLYGADRTIPEMPYPRISAGRLLPASLRGALGQTSAA